MTTVIGVDFSGAKVENKTWIAQGILDAGALTLSYARSIKRDDLRKLLAGIAPPACVAMDFPFCVPDEFAEYVSTSAQAFEMPDVWSTVAAMSKERFIVERDNFVRGNADVEPKRYGDKLYRPESFSPLHKVRPNMVPMTYEGICLLRRLHQDHPQRWYVPPLDASAELSEAVTLLEVMPGAFLKSIGLPCDKPGILYKGGSSWRKARRVEIIDGLAKKSGIALPNLPHSVREDCLANDDCLDAVVAAVCAAAWEHYRSGFQHPAGGAELDYARREGWIYTFRPDFRPG